MLSRKNTRKLSKLLGILTAILYYNNAIPKDTLLRALDYCNLTYDDISDKLIEQPEDDDDLDTLIGELED